MTTTLVIRRGLRRLEFNTAGAEDSTRHVVVEFATKNALTPGQLVHINLGMREGVERILKGVPQLVAPGKPAKNEFLYRLEGRVG